MNQALAPVIVGGAILVGCSSDPPLRPSARLLTAAREAPQQFVVFTVRNPVSAPAFAAAPSPRGYDHAGPYAAGAVALRQSRAVAANFHLRHEPGGAKAACNSFAFAQALSAAIEAHADVINLSLAGPSDHLLTRLVDRAAAGIIVVGAVPADGLPMRSRAISAA